MKLNKIQKKALRKLIDQYHAFKEKSRQAHLLQIFHNETTEGDPRVLDMFSRHIRNHGDVVSYETGDFLYWRIDITFTQFDSVVNAVKGSRAHKRASLSSVANYDQDINNGLPPLKPSVSHEDAQNIVATADGLNELGYKPADEEEALEEFHKGKEIHCVHLKGGSDLALGESDILDSETGLFFVGDMVEWGYE